ncbi:AMP-binding protein [Nesterenkonia jeotgali]|uniref:AMP-binding protein n=1 Tax=Nesterenkonia jeotgali TaxID=317018 RepID=UPI0009FB6BA3|nr:AMP-binding protein [Nesterenkonia jeotgali]
MARTQRTTAAAEVPETTPPTDSWIPAALSALAAALKTNPGSRSDSGIDAPPLEFQPADPAESPTWVTRPEVPVDLAAVIVRTSGSTGTPKQTLLPATAIRASVAATAQALGGHGQWLLTLQPSYVAGLAVLARSLEAGTTPVALLEHTTDPLAFTLAAQQLTAERRYVSLVPTQLQRLLEHLPQEKALAAALARFDAILLGGGASSEDLIARAQAHGLNPVRTYGMSETCGGCVYDGRPLPGVQLETVGTGKQTPSRVRISGPMVAAGYLDDADLDAAHFSWDPGSGQRRFLTDDLGELSTDAQGQLLRLSGRADDVINTGGVKISAERVRSVLLSHPQATEVFVGALPDPEWGQMVGAAVVISTGLDEGELDQDELGRELRELAGDALGRPAAPKRLLFLPRLPTLASGKPDRQRLLQMLRTQAG